MSSIYQSVFKNNSSFFLLPFIIILRFNSHCIYFCSDIFKSIEFLLHLVYLLLLLCHVDLAFAGSYYIASYFDSLLGLNLGKKFSDFVLLDWGTSHGLEHTVNVGSLHIKIFENWLKVWHLFTYLYTYFTLILNS